MFTRMCWILTALGAAVGLLELISGIGGAESAPQEAAAAAIAVALAVIPYVFTRAMEGALAKEGTSDQQ